MAEVKYLFKKEQVWHSFCCLIGITNKKLVMNKIKFIKNIYPALNTHQNRLKK